MYEFKIYRSVDSEPIVIILEESKLGEYHIDALTVNFLYKYDKLPKKVKEKIKKSMCKKYGR